MDTASPPGTSDRTTGSGSKSVKLFSWPPFTITKTRPAVSAVSRTERRVRAKR